MNHEVFECGHITGVDSCNAIASNFYNIGEHDWMIGYYSDVEGYVAVCKKHRRELEKSRSVKRVNREEYKSALLVGG